MRRCGIVTADPVMCIYKKEAIYVVENAKEQGSGPYDSPSGNKGRHNGQSEKTVTYAYEPDVVR